MPDIDIVDRLRREVVWESDVGKLLNAAADEIARLRLTVEEQDAVRHFSGHYAGFYGKALHGLALRLGMYELPRNTPATPASAGNTNAPDIVTHLRQTRANMIGTDDEQHYWDCHDAATEIEQLRLSIRLLADQDATLSVCNSNVIVTMDATLTDEEREAIKIVTDWATEHLGEDDLGVIALRNLLERTK